MNRKWGVRGLIADLVIVVLVLANLFVAQGIWRAEDVEEVNLVLVLLGVAFVCFLLATFAVDGRRIKSWRDLAFAVIVLAAIASQLIVG